MLLIKYSVVIFTTHTVIHLYYHLRVVVFIAVHCGLHCVCIVSVCGQVFIAGYRVCGECDAKNFDSLCALK